MTLGVKALGSPRSGIELRVILDVRAPEQLLGTLLGRDRLDFLFIEVNL